MELLGRMDGAVTASTQLLTGKYHVTSVRAVSGVSAKFRTRIRYIDRLKMFVTNINIMRAFKCFTFLVNKLHSTVSNGCSIGCAECDGGAAPHPGANPNTVDRCNSGAVATINDPK